MNDAAKKARRAYIRAWQRANKDKVAKNQERYWTKKAREMELDSAESEPTKTD